MHPLFTSLQYTGKPELPVVKCASAMLVWLFASACVFGQVTKTQRTMEVEMLTVEDGLPQGFVNGTVQDQAGFLWFNTMDGLSRFDGYDFTIFRKNIDDLHSIAGNNTSQIIQCHSGFLWFNIIGKGFGRYDPKTGQFTLARRSNNIDEWNWLSYTPTIGPDGTIWIPTENELLYVDDANEPRPVLRTFTELDPGMPTILKQIGSLHFDEHGRLWTSDAKKELVYCMWKNDEGEWVVHEWRISLPEVMTANASFIKHEFIGDPTHGRLMITNKSKLYYFNSNDLSLVDSIALPDSAWIRQVYGAEPTGAFLYQGTHQPFLRFDPESKKLTRILVGENTQPGPEQKFTILGTSEDRLGNTWGWTNGFGGFRISRFTDRFETRDFWAGADHLPLCQDHYTISRHQQTGSIFLNDELKRKHASALQWSYATLPDKKGRWEPGPMDSEGRLWGLFHSTADSIYVFGYLDTIAKFHELDLLGSASRIVVVLHGYDDNIWLGVWDKDERTEAVDRLVQFDTKERRIISSHQLPARIPQGDYNYFQQFSLAPDSTIWMATPLGLFTLNLHDGHWRSFFHDPANEHSIPNNNVFSLCPDPVQPNDFMWVGTNGSGMAKMNKHTGHCEVYTQADGLPNNVIYSILSDSLDRLWISTNQGICQFNTRNGHIQNFTESDGLSGNEFNRHNSSISVDGRLIFGGVKGTTVIDPLDFKNETIASNTVITGLQFADGALNDSIIRYDPAYWSESDTYSPPTLTLAHDEPLLRIHFACLDHTSPERNEYRYRLVGQNDEWVNNGTEHYASFSNLPSGDYTFEVQGKNSNGVWDEEGARMNIQVLTPWYQTWWFKAFYILTFLALVYLAYRYRLAQAIEMNRLRSSIARDLHDEIGSTLSSVSMYAAVAQENEDPNEVDNTELLVKISEGTTSAMEAMNDIVWAVNATNDSMRDLTQRMNSFAIGLGESQNFEIVFNVKEELLDLNVDMRIRKEVFMIFKEAVNNAAKYSGCSTLEVDMNGQNEHLYLRIKDDGKGFDPEQISEHLLGGNGLANMKTRAELIGGQLELNSTIGSGTEVLLRFKPRKKSLISRT